MSTQRGDVRTSLRVFFEQCDARQLRSSRDHFEVVMALDESLGIERTFSTRQKQLVTICANLSRIGLHEIKKDVTMIRVKCEQLATDRSCHRQRIEVRFTSRFGSLKSERRTFEA